MLRLMLDEHPQVSMFGEYEFIVDYLPKDGWPDTFDYVSKLRSNRVFVHWGLRADPALGFRELVNTFLTQRARDGVRVLGATVHRKFDQLPRIWPEARYIHLLRDPRDVARSVVQMGWAGNAWSGARYWREAEETWGRLRGIVPPGRLHEVRFEELVLSPQEVLTGTCLFLGLKYTDAMLQYPSHTSYGPPDPRIAYKWRSGMRRREVADVEAQVGDMLSERGYAGTCGERVRVSLPRQGALIVHDKVGRVRFKIRRYGLRLCALSWLARRGRVRWLEDRSRRAMWAIDERNLK